MSATVANTAKKPMSCLTRHVIGFRDFILRGNVVDLAVAIVVGTAFTAVVRALVTDILTPLIAAIYGGSDFATLTFTVHRSKFLIGDFINQIITFIIIAFVIYFCVVVPVGAAMNKYFPKKAKTTCPFCAEEIIKAATRCRFCCSEIATAPAAAPAGKELPV